MCEKSRKSFINVAVVIEAGDACSRVARAVSLNHSLPVHLTLEGREDSDNVVGQGPRQDRLHQSQHKRERIVHARNFQESLEGEIISVL